MLNLERTRERFPILKSKIHLANCSQGAIAQEVIEAIDEYKDTLVFSGMEWGRWMEEAPFFWAALAVLVLWRSPGRRPSETTPCFPFRSR